MGAKSTTKKKKKRSVAESDAPVKSSKKKASAKSSDESQIAQAKKIIKAAGKSGISAEDIAREMNLVKKNMEAADRSAGLKKARVLARKATDGAATKRDGRTALYVL